MVNREAIVIGGSAGAIEALIALVHGLPFDLPATVLVVIHVPAGSQSLLPAILARSTQLPVTHAQHGEPVEQGRIYLAPPDRHMRIRHGQLELDRGPRENHSRPAIDPLFRSAARAYGPRAIGVILSGALYDGASGLLAVKTHGGLAIVQDPYEAITPSMPRSALDMVQADYVLPAKDIGPQLERLVLESIRAEEGNAMDEVERITRVIEQNFAEQVLNRRAGDTTVYTCPDCGGVLWQTDSGGGFRCHVGHAYAAESLLVQKSEELETALWASVRLLRERAALTKQTAIRTLALGNEELATRIEEQARFDEQHAQVIRELLESGTTVSDHASDVLAALSSAADVSDHT
jgi:two-component system chemotaxis response regulator CheB